MTLTGYEMLRDPLGGEENNNADNNGDKTLSTEKVAESTTPNVKKRHNHRRMKSNGVKTGNAGSGNSGNDGDDPDAGFEFHIVSLDNKQWHFEASCAEERDEWVMAIEQQILIDDQLDRGLPDPDAAIGTYPAHIAEAPGGC